ncbi:hypothetical protein E2986_11111 [Frieseomelitta varia]|uniref:Uncharacterized protein n=1 Tax=Frieseomelitta varia TaxID=561572 RepID=A0A833RFA1_9HYME|nr:hypothetical protein E2986_11111 [Frieseomelitta varia]
MSSRLCSFILVHPRDKAADRCTTTSASVIHHHRSFGAIVSARMVVATRYSTNTPFFVAALLERVDDLPISWLVDRFALAAKMSVYGKETPISTKSDAIIRILNEMSLLELAFAERRIYNFMAVVTVAVRTFHRSAISELTFLWLVNSKLRSYKLCIYCPILNEKYCRQLSFDSPMSEQCTFCGARAGEI